MAYATVSHVQSTNAARGTYTGSSIPNVTAVQQFLDESAGMIDATLTQAGYIVPVGTSTPTSALLVLQQANAVGAAYMVEASAQVSPKLDQFKKMWDEALASLAASDLPGLTKSNRMPRQSATVYEPEFTRDMVL